MLDTILVLVILAAVAYGVRQVIRKRKAQRADAGSGGGSAPVAPDRRPPQRPV